MKGKGLRLGRILGIELRLDYTWFIFLVMLVSSLARHYFPDTHPGWTRATYWAMGLLTSVMFFASIVAHELAHSLVSRSQGVPVHDITLYIFGGAAHTSEEPKRARDELRMALVGPATSLLVAAGFGLLWWLTQGVGGAAHALAGWLARINLVLGLFNLIPGFPLDGGRVFRAIVWSATGNLRRATQSASTLGRSVAFGFILVGLWQILAGNWADGLWIAFIGWFLNSAAASALQQTLVQELLKGHTVREAIMTDCPHVVPQLTLDVVVEHVVVPGGRRCFPVMAGDKMMGLLTLQDIQNVPRAQWRSTRVATAMTLADDLEAVRPDDPLAAVFERMLVGDVSQYPVMEGGRFLGMIARENLASYLRAQAGLA